MLFLYLYLLLFANHSILQFMGQRQAFRKDLKTFSDTFTTICSPYIIDESSKRVFTLIQNQYANPVAHVLFHYLHNYSTVAMLADISSLEKLTILFVFPYILFLTNACATIKCWYHKYSIYSPTGTIG